MISTKGHFNTLAEIIRNEGFRLALSWDLATTFRENKTYQKILLTFSDLPKDMFTDLRVGSRSYYPDSTVTRNWYGVPIRIDRSEKAKEDYMLLADPVNFKF